MRIIFTQSINDIPNSSERLKMCSEKMASYTAASSPGSGARQRTFNTITATIPTDGAPIAGAPYDIIFASLALHVLVGHEAMDVATARSRYALVFSSLLASLREVLHHYYIDIISLINKLSSHSSWSDGNVMAHTYIHIGWSSRVW
jgi:hypothetical protein